MRILGVSWVALFALVACKSSTTDPVGVPAQDRPAPFAPGTLVQLQAVGADCSPDAAGVTFCTTTNPDCALTFDSDGKLTHLRCTVETLVFDCTRACPDELACTWSDAPGCADVYTAEGVFEGYRCGDALQQQLQCGPGNVGCAGLDETTCQADATCRPNYCPTCDGQVFTLCQGANDPPADCAIPQCPACDGLDEQACTASATCHPVYHDAQNCGCAPLGCCTRYEGCAAPAQANCTGDTGGATCNLAPPHCEGDYVISYANGCFEGCVKKSECAAACAPDGSFPAFDKTCTSASDCAIGIHQTDCCGTEHALGIEAGDATRFAETVKLCDPVYPACECPTRGIVAEDGQSTFDATGVAVRCTDAGACETYVP